MANIGPGPVPADQLHTSLIDQLHGAMSHPHLPADHKAEYAGVLNVLMRRQAKNQQALGPYRGQQHAPVQPPAAAGGLDLRSLLAGRPYGGGQMFDEGPPTPDSETSALLAALFPPAQQAPPQFPPGRGPVY